MLEARGRLRQCIEHFGSIQTADSEVTPDLSRQRQRRHQTILNKIVYAGPHNQEAKDLLADVYEQIGYQKESPSVRNSFLAAAYELRNDFPSGVTAETVNPDTVRAMSTDLLLEVGDIPSVSSLCRQINPGRSGQL